MILVLDTSVVVDLLLRREPAYQRIVQHMQQAEWLAAPHLLDIEVTQALRRFVLQGALGVGRAETLGAELLTGDAAFSTVPQTNVVVRFL